MVDMEGACRAWEMNESDYPASLEDKFCSPKSTIHGS